MFLPNVGRTNGTEGRRILDGRLENGLKIGLCSCTGVLDTPKLMLHHLCRVQILSSHGAGAFAAFAFTSGFAPM